MLEANQHQHAELWRWEPGDGTRYMVYAADYNGCLHVSIGTSDIIRFGYFVPVHNALHVAEVCIEEQEVAFDMPSSKMQALREDHTFNYYKSHLYHINDKKLDDYLIVMAQIFAALWYSGLVHDEGFSTELVEKTYRDWECGSMWQLVYDRIKERL